MFAHCLFPIIAVALRRRKDPQAGLWEPYYFCRIYLSLNLGSVSLSGLYRVILCNYRLSPGSRTYRSRNISFFLCTNCQKSTCTSWGHTLWKASFSLRHSTRYMTEACLWRICWRVFRSRNHSFTCLSYPCNVNVRMNHVCNTLCLCKSKISRSRKVNCLDVSVLGNRDISCGIYDLVCNTASVSKAENPDWNTFFSGSITLVSSPDSSYTFTS